MLRLALTLSFLFSTACILPHVDDGSPSSAEFGDLTEAEKTQPAWAVRDRRQHERQPWVKPGSEPAKKLGFFRTESEERECTTFRLGGGAPEAKRIVEGVKFNCKDAYKYHVSATLTCKKDPKISIPMPVGNKLLYWRLGKEEGQVRSAVDGHIDFILFSKKAHMLRDELVLSANRDFSKPLQNSEVIEFQNCN